jgi:para-nitrobenzyl esterase
MSIRWNRRDLINTALSATALTILPRTSFAELSRSTIPVAPFVEVEIESGKVRGGQCRGAIAFKGIPYAGDVSGLNRFKVAPPVKSWTGVFDATHLGPPAMQPPKNTYGEQEPAMNENCLVLNVWTPEASKNHKRPVMLYIHGGGYIHGSGGSPTQDGSRLAATYDVVVVACNHRLGMMGYLYLGDIDPSYEQHANVGMQDIVATLKWIKANIAAFGGDPNNVTVMGESGGGGKVGTLLGMPQAVGLFHKAGIESGAWRTRMNKDVASETTLRLLKALNIPTKKIHQLNDVPINTLLELQNAVDHGEGALLIPTDSSKTFDVKGPDHDKPGHFSPMVDGHIVPAHPFDPIATPISANIPLMIAFNHDEAMFFHRDKPEVFSMNDAELINRIRQQTGDKADRIIAAYRNAMPKASPSDIFIAIDTARSFGNDTFALAALKSKQPAPVYFYLYDYQSNVPVAGTDTTLKACHASDIAPTFYNYDQNGLHGNGPGLAQASTNLSALWTSFARTGTPAARGVPDWPRYDTKTRSVMLVDSTCKVVNDPDAEIRKMWESIA